MNPSAALFCLCVVAVYAAGQSAGRRAGSPARSKREISGLYPFPRVGRAEASWTSELLGPREAKRQSLIPFPRVGRSPGDEASGRKRDAPENGGGMWFGPRLGRLQKRSREDTWALVRLQDFPMTEDRREHFMRESTEEPDQSRDYRT